MDFTQPTTKQEMFEVLKEIYQHYRIRRSVWEQVDLRQLELTRMDFIPLTEEEIRQKATQLVMIEHKQLINEKLSQIQLEINKRQSQLGVFRGQLSTAKTTITNRYELRKAEVIKEATKRGMANSGVVQTQLAELELQAEKDLYAVESKYESKISIVEGEISAYQNAYAQAESESAELLEMRVTAKILQLNDAQQLAEKEVFTYNNGLDEREQRSRNNIAQTKASLELRYMDATLKPFTKEELVEMGYYQDVIECITSYYNTLDALAAYRDFIEETKLSIYLEDYYPDILYNYKTKAGL